MSGALQFLSHPFSLDVAALQMPTCCVTRASHWFPQSGTEKPCISQRGRRGFFLREAGHRLFGLRDFKIAAAIGAATDRDCGTCAEKYSSNDPEHSRNEMGVGLIRGVTLWSIPNAQDHHSRTASVTALSLGTLTPALANYGHCIEQPDAADCRTYNMPNLPPAKTGPIVQKPIVHAHNLHYPLRRARSGLPLGMARGYAPRRIDLSGGAYLAAVARFPSLVTGSPEGTGEALEPPVSGASLYLALRFCRVQCMGSAAHKSRNSFFHSAGVTHLEAARYGFNGPWWWEAVSLAGEIKGKIAPKESIHSCKTFGG